MGWTSYRADHYKNGKVDVKAECDAYYNDDYYILVKSAMVGSVHYAAVKSKHDDFKTTYARVLLTSVDNNDYYNFAYKDLSEDMGPAERKCPMSIIKLLDPTDSKWANEWRQDCIAYAEHKKSPNNINKLPVGARIRFNRGNDEITLVKCAPAYQFKRNWWLIEGRNNYFPANRIPLEYEVLS